MKKGVITRTDCSNRLKKVYDLLLDSDLNFKDYCFIMNFIIEIIEDNIDLGQYIDRCELKEKVKKND